MEVLLNLISTNFVGTTIWLSTAVIGLFISRKVINKDFSYPDLQATWKKWWIKQKLRNWKTRNYSQSIDYSQEKSLDFAVKNDDSSDFEELVFFGADENGSILLVNFKRFANRNEIWIYLRLHDGRILTLPENEVTTVSLNDARTYKCKGLTLELLQPYSKWRITYNGLLRIQANSVSTNTDGDDREKSQHVIFTFFWTVASRAISWPKDLHIPLLTDKIFVSNSLKSYEHLFKLLNNELGFSQCGSLFGQISIENDNRNSTQREIFELNLPGIRQRNLGLDGTKNVELSANSINVYGVLRDGLVCFVSVKSFTSSDFSMPFGFVRKPNGESFILESMDISGLSDDPLQLNKRKITFTVHEQKYNMEFQFKEGAANKIYAERPISVRIHFAVPSIELDGITGHGLILWKHFIKDDEPKPVLSNVAFNEKFRKAELIHPLEVPLDKTALVVWFSDISSQNELLSGGKGASLAFISRLKENNKKLPCPDFTVPNGFILTTTAYNFQVWRNHAIQKGISDVKNAYKRNDMTLESACQELTDTFKKIAILPEIVDSVTKMYTEMEKQSEAPLKFAVRSSAVGEDSTSSSSAGQNDTFLGLKSIDEVLHAIRKCWASLFSYQSVSYRQQNVQPIDAQMAVVIQAMVPSDSAGVLFTNYPTNNDPNKMLITANFGLGESVVSGMVDPDTFTIYRDYNDEHLRVIQKQRGQKGHFVHMSSEFEILATSESKREKRQAYCLTEEQTLKLCEIGIYLEYCYETPRDIEWALYEGRIYLLQSRPMTSINAFSTWELLHEFDSAIMSCDDLCTFANIGEVMPETLTPLTLSTYAQLAGQGITATVFPNNDFSKLYSKMLQSSHFRFALQIYSLFLLRVEKEISVADKVNGLAIFGHNYLTEKIHKIAIHRNGVMSFRQKLAALWDVFHCCWNNRALSDELQKFTYKFIGTYDLKKLEQYMSLTSLYDDIYRKIKAMRYPNTTHSIITKVNTIYQVFMFNVLVEGKTDFNADHYADIALMLSSCKEVESAEIPILLEDIARVIYKSGKHKEFSAVDSKDGIKWLQNNCREAHRLFENFLIKNCHRAFKEFDFATVTWGMHPEIVIDMIQVSTRNMTGSDSFKPKKERTNAEIIGSLKTPKKFLTRELIRFLLPLCKASVQLRERSKSNYIAYIHEIRKAFRYLGQRMYEEGLLPDAEILFYLTHQEICEIIKEKKFYSISKSIRRRRLFPEWSKLRFAELQFGVIKPLAIKRNPNANGTSSVIVSGTPVCEGVITGRACVVNNFAEVSKIQNGDILITHSTDIGWSPYFPILSAVVTELGGLISHGAVVAREYGLPCIVGAANATNLISDGDIVCINANTGVISKVN